MKRKLVFVFVLLYGSLWAQTGVNWTVPLNDKGNVIFFHAFTQTPIVETAGAYYGIDAEKKAVLWTVEKSAALKALKSVNTVSALTGGGDITGGMELNEYTEIPYTQYAIIGKNLLDAATGEVVVGEGKKTYKSVISYDIVPELNLLLFQVKSGEGGRRLYAIDIATNKIVWETKLKEANEGKDVMKMVAKAAGLQALNLFAPIANADGNIIYNNDGILVLLNGQTGEILWQNACNPGTFFMDREQKKLYVIEKRSGMSTVLPWKAMKAFGKKVYCLDAMTGKNLWRNPVKLEASYVSYAFVNDGQILLAHEDGVNLYDVSTGNKVWKKDYKAGNLKEMTATPAGVELLYGNKIMLVNLQTGKKVWKKPIELADVDENSKFDPVRREYDKTRLIVTEGAVIVYDRKSGKKKWALSIPKDSRIAFDDANGKVLIASKFIYIIDPEIQAKKPKPAEAKVKNPKDIAGYEVNDKNYFIYGAAEYLVIDKKAKVLEHKVYPQLKGKQWLRAGLTLVNAVSGVMGSRVEFYNGQEKTGEAGLFVNAEAAKTFAEAAQAQTDFYKHLKQNDKQRRAVRVNGQQAYFLRGIKENGEEKIGLVVVDKCTGQELKTIDFTNNRDVVYEIDLYNNRLYYADDNQLKVIDL